MGAPEPPTRICEKENLHHPNPLSVGLGPSKGAVLLLTLEVPERYNSLIKNGDQLVVLERSNSAILKHANFMEIQSSCLGLSQDVTLWRRRGCYVCRTST